MNPNEAHLASLLYAIGQTLQKWCVEKTSRNYFPATSETHAWIAPPLRPKGSFEDIKLTKLTDLLYGAAFTETFAIQVWDEITKDIHSSSAALKRMFRADFPGAPLSISRQESSYWVLAKTIYLISISTPGAKLVLQPNEIGVTIGGTFMGMTNRTIWSSRGVTPLKTIKDTDFVIALESRGGRKLVGTAKTSAIYRGLCDVFPELRTKLEMIFAIAIAAGRSHEDLLTDMFFVAESQAPQTIWTVARTIVNKAELNPVDDLHRLLGEILGSRAFEKLFGNPYRAKGHKYTEKTRDRHLSAISSLEGARTSRKQIERELDGPPPVTPILELQALIGQL